MAKLLIWTRRHPRHVILVSCAALLAMLTMGAFLWSQYHLRAAEQAIAQDALEQAQSHLDLCLLVRFRSASIHLLAARVARRRGSYTEAARHLAACEQLEGSTSSASLERLLLTAQQGDLDGMDRLFYDRKDGDSAEAALILEALAEGYENRYWHTEALTCLNALLQRQPHHHRALLLRAQIAVRQARNGFPERDLDALRDLEKALELHPSFGARLELAGVYFRIGRPWDALLEFEGLRQEQSDDPAVLLGLARCRFNLHAVNEARQLLDELLARHPQNAGACLERGQLALHDGQVSEAAEWLLRAMAAKPHDTEALRLLGECLALEGKEDEARQCRKRLGDEEAKALDVNRLILQANRDPHNVGIRLEVAKKLKQLGREEEFVATLFLVLEQDPQNSSARRELADYLERHGQSDRAARYRSQGGAGTETELLAE